MEGLADVGMAAKNVMEVEKQKPQVLMYAGGLHERYGLKTLTEAFAQLDNSNWNLVIYGSGPFAKDLVK